MNLYDVLAGQGTTHFERLFSQRFAGGAVQTLTGQPPLTFKADGKPLISWSMKGNGQQSGTPTPDAPIMPTFCGVRTANLFDEDYPNISGTIRYIPLYVGNGSCTLSTTTPYDSSVANLFLLSGNVSTGASTPNNGAWLNHKVTAQSDNGYITIAYRHYSGTTSPAECKTMLNSGSTASPYEPYGYKIPITCAGQTTPVYLGEVPTVRRTSKLVLTGDENVTDISGYYNCGVTISSIAWRTAVSTTGGFTASNNGRALWASKSHFSAFTTAAEFKAYLQQQYAAGNPVTVWYVLNTPETAIVNKPLAKIGDYADELSSEDAAVTIPTAKGQNTLTVDTELQPSSMTITFK